MEMNLVIFKQRSIVRTLGSIYAQTLYLFALYSMLYWLMSHEARIKKRVKLTAIIFFFLKVFFADIQASTVDLSSQAFVYNAVLRYNLQPCFTGSLRYFVFSRRNSENSDSNMLSTCPTAEYGAIRSWHRSKNYRK